MTSVLAAPASRTEAMVSAAARQLAGARLCFVGIGLPNLVCNLARKTVAPELELVYEAGVYAAKPSRLPLSIGDPCLVPGSSQVGGLYDLFTYYLQAGRIDVAFLGGAQIDRRGNLNTTVIGDYRKPRVRLPGSGGACEIAIHAREIFIVMSQSPRSFVESVDFVTSPGHRAELNSWDRPGRGPTLVVTQLGLYRFDETGEMVLSQLHPGVTVDEARAQTGWPLTIASDIRESAGPSEQELRLIREELDPDGLYAR